MNSLMQNQYPVFRLYQALRQQLMPLLSAADLHFRPGPDALTLGALCLEVGETERAYIDSFLTWKQNFDYRHPEPGIAGSVTALTAWFDALDQELEGVLAAMSEDELARHVVRGPDFTLPVPIQLEVYKEALLIFYGKVSIYLRLMGQPRPQQWQEWIG